MLVIHCKITSKRLRSTFITKKKWPSITWPFSFILMRFLLIALRTGNLVVPDLGAEVMNDVNSSSEPVKLEDLQRILSNICVMLR